MSMCLYLKAGPKLELTRLAKDGEALANLAMSGFGGGGGPIKPINEVTMSRQKAERERLYGPEVKQLMKAAHERLQQRWAELERLHGVPATELMKRAIAQLKQGATGNSAGAAAAATGAAAGDRGSGGVLDLHKSWHLLHYLFTGSAGEAPPPGGLLLSGGKEIGEDLGYGPPHLLDPAETKTFAAFLAPLSLTQLYQRLDLEKMAQLELYAVSPDAADLREELAEYFPRLKDYVEQAAARGDSLLIWLS